MDKISENQTIEFEINNVVFTNFDLIDSKNNIDDKFIDITNNSNYNGFEIYLNNMIIYPLSHIILFD